MIIFSRVTESPMSRLDPRTRLLVALVFAVTVSFLWRPVALCVAIAFSLFAAYGARVNWRHLSKVLFTVNFFLLLLAISLSLVPSENGGWLVKREGLEMGATIALRSNAILLAIAAFLGTMEPAHLGMAMDRMRFPSRFTQPFLFMIRYIEVIHREYHRLRDAMAVRGFRPRANRPTLRAYGYLIGMLLLRCFDRADRVRDAMKCRGFQGRYPSLFPFRFGPQDAVFATFSIAFLVGLLMLGGRGDGLPSGLVRDISELTYPASLRR